jgi:putative hydrolase of the HAD superfamily
MFEMIAFDADDTLWHNEALYTQTQEKFKELLSAYRDPEEILPGLEEIEFENIPHYGYGIKGFILSMVEAALALSEGRISTDDLLTVVGYAKHMIQSETPLLEGVRETVEQVAQSHRLMLITKGDLVDQERKIAESGLAEFFQYCEVLSDKTVESYAGVLEKHDLSAEKFLMVGNSPRSDILPIVELGGTAVHIPYHTTWAHEVVEHGDGDKPYYELDDIRQLPELIARLEQGQG